MYIDLKERYTKRLPIEALGGNIITIADLYCQTVPVDQRLSLDKLDRIKKKFHDLTGKLFLSEVVEAFVKMIEEELLSTAAIEKFSQVLIFSDQPASLYPMELCLKNEGFRPITETSPARLTTLYERNKPDILILCLHKKADKIIRFIDALKSKGIDIKSMPTLVLAEADETAKLTVLLERGVEDVITIDSNFDMFVAKLKKIQQQILEKTRKLGEFDGNASGAMGRLANMNLIDLLQAMGPSRKTVRISVISASDLTNTFDLYLDNGVIRYAVWNDLVGAEAVYEALSWDDGAWTIEPMNADEMPEPNNDLPNEMILMEGCRLLDEKTRKYERTP
jgi:DNA-binding response OmpR family regulator